MAKRRVKKTVKQPASSPQGDIIDDANAKAPQLEKRKNSLIDEEGTVSNLLFFYFFLSFF